MKKAVGLKYDKNDINNAPRVIALGRGEIARKIIETAQKHGVPLYEEPVLVERLLDLEIDQEIPEELYHAIAEILAFIYKLNREQEAL